jgi:signal transduction histidine kinase
VTAKQGILRQTGLAVVIITVTIILLLYFFANTLVFTFNPPYLRLILNAVFISATNIFVAVVSIRSFLRHGEISFALLSGALVASGLSAFLSGLLSPIDTNANFTLFNIGFLLSSVMQAFGAIYLSAAAPTSKLVSNRKIAITAMLAFPIIVLTLSTALALLGLAPAFIDAAGASTDLRQFVVGLTFVFFVFSSAAFAYQYLHTKAQALYWYALALALFAVDAFVGYNSAELGNLLQWAGRVSDYLGGVFFIFAILALRNQAFVGADFSERWFEIVSNNRNKLSSLFSNMLSGFAYLRVVFDAKGKAVDAVFLEVNDSFEFNTGLKRANVVGKSFTELVGEIEQNSGGWIEFLGTIVGKGEPAKTEIYTSGLGRWLKVSAYTPEKNFVAVLIDDITRQKQLQSELEKYNKDLERIVEQRTKELKEKERLATIGATAGWVGHDIRNPLQAIIGDVYLIDKEIKAKPKLASPRIKESIDAINYNITYIDKIVSDLQDYTKELFPKYSTVQLKGIVENVLTERKTAANIAVTISTGDLAFKTDAIFLNRILTNLITNAIQAMPDGGKLTISALQVDKKVRILVQDTGEGLSQEAKENLFKPLFTTKAKGQGFGLAVVKRLIDSLNGNIEFESKTGEGTTVIVELPA